MIPLWWSLLLTAVGVAGWWLVGRKKKSGFVLDIGAQFLWVTYAFATQQWGFILSAVLYGAVQAHGLHKWVKEEKDEALR